MVSAASIWEIAIKRALGRLEAPEDTVDALRRSDLESLEITVDHAWAAGALARHHDDPFDRLLVAQAQLERLTLVTRDPAMGEYDVPLMAA